MLFRPFGAGVSLQYHHPNALDQTPTPFPRSRLHPQAFGLGVFLTSNSLFPFAFGKVRVSLLNFEFSVPDVVVGIFSMIRPSSALLCTSVH